MMECWLLWLRLVAEPPLYDTSFTVLCLSSVGALILLSLSARALEAGDLRSFGVCFIEEIEWRRRSGEIGFETSICIELLASGWNLAVFRSSFDSSSEEV